MSVIGVLSDEHRIIKRMLSVLEEVTQRLASNQQVPPSVLDGVLAFFRLIADGVHHGKEERVLFPALVKHDIGPDQPFINALLGHHEMGRDYVQRLEVNWVRMRQGDPQALTALVATARDYVDLMREHIRIEDEFFQGQAAECLSAEDEEDLARGFEAVESRMQVGDWPERYREDLAAYERALGRS